MERTLKIDNDIYLKIKVIAAKHDVKIKHLVNEILKEVLNDEAFINKIIEKIKSSK